MISQVSPQSDSLETVTDGTISIYKKGKVSTETFALCQKELEKSKPRLTKGWYDVLDKMIDVDGFTDERLIAATQALIRNCPYPEPSHAEILNYDLRVKIYTEEELLTKTKDLSSEARKSYLNNFLPIEYYGGWRYANKDDVIKYSLPIWKSKKERLEELKLDQRIRLINKLVKENRINLVKEAAISIVSFIKEITLEDINLIEDESGGTKNENRI